MKVLINKIIKMETRAPGVKTKQQIAEEYGICTKTLNKILQKKQIEIDRGLILPRDQSIIYEKLGVPK